MTSDEGKKEAFGPELTPAQVERQDVVDNACHALLQELAGKELEWDIAHIGDLVEVCKDIICTELAIMTEMEFYPYIDN